MAQTYELEKYIHHGPPLYTPLNMDSLGIQIYNSLARNRDKDLFINASSRVKVSYSHFFKSTCTLAQALRNINLKQNDVISICSENSERFFEPVVASFYLGVVVAPINHSYIESELLHAVNLTKPKIVFCSASVVNKFLKIRTNCTFIEKIIVIDSTERITDVENLNCFVHENVDQYFDEYSFKPIEVDVNDQLAVILCSSGTTGLPKGVMTTHGNINVRLNHTRDPRLHIISEINCKLGLLPFFHGFGFMTTLGAIVTGDVIIVMPRFEERLFYSSIQHYKIEELCLVPPILVLMAKSNLVLNYDLSCIKEVTSGAAPLSKNIEETVKRRLNLKCIRQGYGLTEATLAVIMMPQNEERPGCSGKVVPGISVKIRDPITGKTAGPHVVGELCIKGGMVMKGYYNNPKATSETFTNDGWLLTGDMGYFDKDGYFYIVDRLKELIKYKGFQVAPAELEALLLKHPSIQDAGVIGLPDELAGELPLAFVVKQGDELTEDDVKKYISENASHSKWLHGGVRFIGAIPKNPSGKILRRELRNLLNTIKSKL